MRGEAGAARLNKIGNIFMENEITELCCDHDWYPVYRYLGQLSAAYCILANIIYLLSSLSRM